MPQIDWSSLPGIRVWRDVDAEVFHGDIVPAGEPAVLKNLVSHWPVVARGVESPQVLGEYIRSLDPGENVKAFFGEPEIAGRFFYNADLTGFNFERRELPIGELIDVLLEQIDDDGAACIYAGAIPLRNQLSRLLDENPMELLDPDVEQLRSIWIGNRSRTAAHWDLARNIACVVAGRRRFTLFPPEQLANLYVGPVDFTLAGQPISLVDFHDPDFDRFPRFQTALAAAQVAELHPGDAIYIPSMWFHHVESLDPFGVLVNFWWRDAELYMFTPLHTLLHALLSMRDLPEVEKKAWRTMFDHYIFGLNGDPMAHIPENARGAFGAMTPERVNGLRAFLIQKLGGRVPG